VHEKLDGNWVIFTDGLTQASLDKACAKPTFKSETRKAVDNALVTLRTVFADDPAKLELLNQLGD
jgi:hypothetical protein